MTETTTNRAHLERHGWVLVKGVFAPDEVRSLRDKMAASRLDGDITRYRDNFYVSTADLLSLRHLAPVVRDPRLLSMYRELTGADPVYFGDSTAALGMPTASYGWHKDNADRFDDRAPDWRGRYTILRFGIYLSDHARFSGGLMVRDRSHRVARSDVGRTVNIESVGGDVIVWYLTTTHSPNARRLRALPRLTVNPRFFHRLPRAWVRPTEGERAAMFLSYGTSDAHLERFLEYVSKRKYGVEMWQQARWSAEDMAAANAAGLTLRDPRPLVAGVDAESIIDREDLALPYEAASAP